MSWEAASLVVLAVGLAGGFAWYERSRPSARILALVASLSALAVVGRLAFAPIPNVKPTTDIVLLAGFALGAAPGFAVGATAAVASNFFLGQGPWTPWQMAAWGAVGIAGALLARATRGRELGRWPLALACGAAGAGFGAVLDAYLWTLSGEGGFASYVAISGTSLPYNLAHVIGNITFCLLLGPAFVRALRRYRERFEFSWPAAQSAPAPIVCLVAALAVASGLTFAEPAPAASPSARAVAYLERAQNVDGGFGGSRGQGSTPLFTGWSALGLASAGRSPADVRRRKRSVIDYIRAGSSSLNDVGELERTILVLRASGLSARSFHGRDLVAELVRRRSSNGAFGGRINHTAFGVMALRAVRQGARSPRVRGSLRWLSRQQNGDGGWGFAPRAQSDVDDTAAALEALGSAGRGRGATARRAVGFLRRAQHRDGGFGLYPAAASNAQSTAWAVQGLVAARRNPIRFRRGGRGPLAYLRSLQASDGSVRYSRTSAQTPVWVTAQALAAFERQPFPLPPAPPKRRRARTAEPSAGAAGGPGADRTEGSPHSRPGRRHAARSAASEKGRSDRPSPTTAGDGELGPAAPPPSEARIEPTSATRRPDRATGSSVPGLAALVAAMGALGLLGWRRRRAMSRPA